jgi:polyisoprenoid-binding protein YceI
MKTGLNIFIAIVLLSTSAAAQKFITKNGSISFYSSTPVEDIEAHNNQVNAALDAKTGDFVFRVLIKSFKFEKALMQEHFNENYMESHKYPNATFQGKVTNLTAVDFSAAGSYEAVIEGKLTIHGVTNEIKETGTFTVGSDGIKGNAKFDVKVADYDIEIPKTVINNIAEVIEVTVDVDLKPL